MKGSYKELAADILKNVGGEENVSSLVHCATRLRFRLKNQEKANKKALEQLEGVIAVIESGGQCQVVIGNHVEDVYNAFSEVSHLSLDGTVDAKDDGAANGDRGAKAVVNRFIGMISSVFTPLMSAFCGAGLLKALLILFTTLNWLKADSGTYMVLYAGADAIFMFLPVALSISAAKFFKTNQFVSFIIGASLVYPTLTAAFSAGTKLTFLGIPVILASYTSSVIPAFVAIWALSKVEKLLNKIIPQILKGIFVPLLSIVIVVPATYLIIGPVTDYAGKLLANGYNSLIALSPIVAGGLVALIWPVVVLFGLHWGFVPIVLNNIKVFKRDTLFTITGPNNFCQAGACLGVFLKTRDRDLKTVAGSAALSAFLAGITEPAIYGVNLKFKRPFIIACVFSGIAGAITAAVGAGCSTFIGTGFLTLPAYIGKGFVGFLIACAIAFVGSLVVTYFFGFSDKMLQTDKK